MPVRSPRAASPNGNTFCDWCLLRPIYSRYRICEMYDMLCDTITISSYIDMICRLPVHPPPFVVEPIAGGEA
eukprot:9148648-Pyramimonas_sp.AAC.1